MRCEICDDTGWKTTTVDGVARVTRCDCYREAAAGRVVAEAEIPPRYRQCDLDHFHDYNDTLSKAVGRARRFVDEFPNVDRGLAFIGAPGLGKTHLAIACLRLGAHLKGLRGLFFDTRQLLRRIRQTYDPVTRRTEDERDLVDGIMRADLLVLDDLGAERATEWVEEMLHLIVNTRYNERRPTIVTTNYPVDAPPHAKHAETLVERVGFRMFSRLREMCDFVELSGIDYREAGPNPSAEKLARLDSKGSTSHKDLPRPSARTQARAKLRTGEGGELKWAGGKAGNS